MITIAGNAHAAINEVLTELSYLTPGTGIINTEIKTAGYALLQPLIANRIHGSGIAADGSAIGSILVKTGALRDGFKAFDEGLGWNDDALAERALELEKRYNKAIWHPTVDEEQQVIQLAQNIVNNAFSGK